MSRYPSEEEDKEGKELRSGTRVTIELEGVHKRGRGSVDDYLEQTAIANPHVTIHYIDPDGNEFNYNRSTDQLPPEAVEIKPHPYGVELGRLFQMLKDAKGMTISQFLTSSFSRVSSAVAKRICNTASLSTRASTKKIGQKEADTLYQAIQETKISAPSTDCICPIGEDLLLKGLYHVVPGEFFCCCNASALGLSRKSISDRSGPCLWRWISGAKNYDGRSRSTSGTNRCPNVETVSNE